jgi:hypothetical protein
MEGDDRATRAASHFLAARRLTDGLRDHPEARGLLISLRFHTARVAALADEISGGAGRPDRAPRAA